MPKLTKEQFNLLVEKYLQNAIPVSLTISKEVEEKAEKELNQYIKNGNINLHDMDPLCVYLIISKLKEDKQIGFIQENINYIKEHDEDIFLYNMLSPKPLSYFLSLRVLKELKKIDSDLFQKLLKNSNENLVYGFNHTDYLEFYNYFFDDINKISNNLFIQIFHQHNRLCYNNINDLKDLNKIPSMQANCNKQLIIFLLEKYNSKISNFTPSETLNFISGIDDTEIYKRFVLENKDKINSAFANIDEFNLCDYLSENPQRQVFLITHFFENIIKKQDIKKIIFNLNSKVIIKLYNDHKETFNDMTLKDWIKVCASTRYFNDDYKKILDAFEVTNIEDLFDIKYFTDQWNITDVSSLKYIESKYRDNIKINGILENIDEKTSIFSVNYFKNLKELQFLLKKKIITKNDLEYKKHLSNFILFLENQNIIINMEGNNFKEIEKLFYRIVMGESMTVVYEVSNIQEIAIINRLGKKYFKVNEFTVEQLERYNVKQHKALYQTLKNNGTYSGDYAKLILKLMLMVGFNHAKVMLQINDSFKVLEHLVGNVDLKNIILDEQGNPVLNNKIMNLLFNDKGYFKIKDMLLNQDNDLYKYFPRIFNEWEIIELNKKGKSLHSIIEFLKSDDISMPPKYYRLEGLFKYIGCNNSIVNETLHLHDKMLKRLESTIPRISGSLDDFSYEILKLSDMNGLTVGNRTNCCFTVLGNGYSCLQHALISKNGRILIVKKGNELLAHSWLWRNGDLLCLDNIEVSDNINEVDFFNVYLNFADEIIKKSFESEGINSCIKNITVGFTNFDKPIKGIDVFPCLVSKTCDLKTKEFGKKIGRKRTFVDELPQPIEKVEYSDSKNVQYLIKGAGIFNLGQSSYTYIENRNPVMHYSNLKTYDDNYLQLLNKKLNSLRYIKSELEGNVSSFNLIDAKNLNEVYLNDDWYSIIDQNGIVEEYIYGQDERIQDELPSDSQVVYVKRMKI